MIRKPSLARTFGRHYRKTRDETAAHNATLDELAGPYDPKNPSSGERRRALGPEISRVSKKVAIRHGDPFHVAVRNAMRQLKAEGFVKALKDSWKDVVREARAHRQKLDDIDIELNGIIMFDDEGNLEGWTIEHSQYFQGHGGPTAWIPVGNVSWDDVEREIGETLADVLR